MKKVMKICMSFGMGLTAKGMDCGMVKWVKHGTRCYGKECYNLCEGKTEGGNFRGGSVA